MYRRFENEKKVTINRFCFCQSEKGFFFAKSMLTNFIEFSKIGISPRGMSNIEKRNSMIFVCNGLHFDITIGMQ